MMDKTPPTGLVYLATPYSHPDPAVEQRRFINANKASAALMSKGFHIYSPISHGHPIAKEGRLPGTWAYWEKHSRLILAACKLMIILTQPGWMVSKGVRAERRIAQEFGIPTDFISPDNPFLKQHAPPARPGAESGSNEDETPSELTNS